MLPAQNEEQPKSAALADNPEHFPTYKLFDSLSGLRNQLQGIDLEEIAEAERHVQHIFERLHYLEDFLGIINQLRESQAIVRAEEAQSGQLLAHQQQILSRPSPAVTRLSVVRMITAPSSESRSQHENPDVSLETKPVEPDAEASRHDTDKITYEAEFGSAVIEEPTPEPIDYDDKLLDEMIKNCGEFTANLNLPTTPQAPHSRWATNKSRPTMHVAAGGGTSDKDAAAHQSKDIDRQLKNIVQDYGEDDLYAQGSGLKTKLRIVAAFVVFAAVFGGIYYYWTAQGADSPVVSNQSK